MNQIARVGPVRSLGWLGALLAVVLIAASAISQGALGPASVGGAVLAPVSDVVAEEEVARQRVHYVEPDPALDTDVARSGSIPRPADLPFPVYQDTPCAEVPGCDEPLVVK